MNVFGAKVQGVLSGELKWDDVFTQSAKEWSERRAKQFCFVNIRF